MAIENFAKMKLQHHCTLPASSINEVKTYALLKVVRMSINVNDI